MSYVEEIDRLKAEVERLRESRHRAMTEREVQGDRNITLSVQNMHLRAERDRARDLAAHLEEELAQCWCHGLQRGTQDADFVLPWNAEQRPCPQCANSECDS